MADALAKLAKELACIEEESISIEVQGRKILSPIDLEYINKKFPSEGEIVLAVDDETVDWRQPFIDYLQESKLPQEKSAADQIKRRALSYTLINGAGLSINCGCVVSSPKDCDRGTCRIVWCSPIWPQNEDENQETGILLALND